MTATTRDRLDEDDLIEIERIARMLRDEGQLGNDAVEMLLHSVARVRAELRRDLTRNARNVIEMVWTPTMPTASEIWMNMQASDSNLIVGIPTRERGSTFATRDRDEEVAKRRARARAARKARKRNRR